MRTSLIIKILPFYISADKNQNISFWSVSKIAMLNSKFNKNFIIISPPTTEPLNNPNLNILYLSTDSVNKTSINTNEINNWNINHGVDHIKYTKTAIEKIKLLQPKLIEVEGDYRLAGTLAKHFPKIPTILISHTVFAKKKFISRFIQYFKYIRFIKHIIFVSHSHKNIFNKGFLYCFKKNYVIHNSYAHIPEYTPAVESLLNNKKNQIIFAGRATKNKGYQEYLLALTKTLPKFTNWSALAVFTIENNAIKAEVDAFLNTQEIKNLISSNQLTIIKNLPNTLLFNKFCESKIAVFPTHPSFIEGLPLVGIEAHMAKCAVICSNNLGFSELSSNHAIYLTKVNSDAIHKSIESLITNSNILNTFANNGYHHIKDNYNINDLVKIYDCIREQYLN